MEDSRFPPIDGETGAISRGSMFRNWLIENKKSFRKIKEQKQPVMRPWSDIDDWSEYDSGLPDSPDSAALMLGRNGKGLEKRFSRDSLMKFPDIVNDTVVKKSSWKFGSQDSLGMLDRYSLSPRPLPAIVAGHTQGKHGNISRLKHRARFVVKKKQSIEKMKHLRLNEWTMKEAVENAVSETSASKGQTHKYCTSDMGRSRHEKYVSKALQSLHEKEYLTECNNAFSRIRVLERAQSKELHERSEGDRNDGIDDKVSLIGLYSRKSII